MWAARGCMLSRRAGERLLGSNPQARRRCARYHCAWNHHRIWVNTAPLMRGEQGALTPANRWKRSSWGRAASG